MKLRKILVVFHVFILLLLFPFFIWLFSGSYSSVFSDFLEEIPYLACYLESPSSLEWNSFKKDLLEKAKKEKWSLLFEGDGIPVYIADYGEFLGEGDLFREREDLALLKPGSPVFKNIRNYEFYSEAGTLQIIEGYTSEFPMYMPGFEGALHFRHLDYPGYGILYVMGSDSESVAGIKTLLYRHRVQYQIFEDGLTKRNLMMSLSLLLSNPLFIASIFLLLVVLGEFLLVLFSVFHLMEREIRIHRILGGSRGQVRWRFMRARGREIFFATLFAFPFVIGIAELYSKLSVSPVQGGAFFSGLLFSCVMSVLWITAVSLLYFGKRRWSGGERDVF